MSENRKSLIIRVDSDFHTKLKLFAVANNISIQDYVLGLIQQDLAREEGKSNAKE